MSEMCKKLRENSTATWLVGLSVIFLSCYLVIYVISLTGVCARTREESVFVLEVVGEVAPCDVDSPLLALDGVVVEVDRPGVAESGEGVAAFLLRDVEPVGEGLGRPPVPFAVPAECELVDDGVHLPVRELECRHPVVEFDVCFHSLQIKNPAAWRVKSCWPRG